MNELERTLPKYSGGAEAYRENTRTPSPPRNAAPARGGYPSPAANAGGGFASDPLSTMMRRHALRAFLEEQSGSVAKAFEQMAALAVKNSMGSQGGIGLPDQRMKYKFSPMEFQKTLSNMGYGMGAGADWWRALFKSLDCDEDGAVSLQDMYDALVLDLPPLAGSPGAQRSQSPSARQRSPNRGASPAFGAGDRECQMCGSNLSRGEAFCNVCGTAA